MDTPWFKDITLFNTPVLEFLFNEHLAETVAISFFIVSMVLRLISKIHDTFRNRRIPLALKEKLYEATELYISPDYGRSDPAHCLEPGEVKDRYINLIDYLENSFVKKSGQSRYIILASAGMGKSALLYNLYNRHLKRFFRAHEMHLIELNVKGALDRIAEIKNQESAVLLLDALDENSDALLDLPDVIKEITEKTQRFYRVALTCRTQFFNRAEEIPDILANIGGVVSAGAHNKGAYEKIFIYPFTQTQIEIFLLRKYLLRFSGFSLLNYFRARKTFKKVPYISVRPMLLTYIDYLLKVDIDSKYTFKIYEAMIYGWLQRRKSDELDPKLGGNLKFVYHLAILMARKHSENGGYFVDKEEANKLANELDADLTDWQISGRSLLNINANGKYKFAHLSIMESLLARAYINNISFKDWERSALTKEFVKEMIKYKSNSSLNSITAPKSYFVADMAAEFDRLSFDSHIYTDDENDSDSAMTPENIPTQTNEELKDYSFVDMSGKSFENMKFSNQLFRGANLSNIRMTTCDLKTTDFTGANLSGSIFNDCDITKSCFLGSDITSTQFINCKLDNSDFSLVRIENGDSLLYPLFTNSSLYDTNVPNDYMSYFREVSTANIIRDLDNVELI